MYVGQQSILWHQQRHWKLHSLLVTLFGIHQYRIYSLFGVFCLDSSDKKNSLFKYLILFWWLLVLYHEHYCFMFLSSVTLALSYFMTQINFFKKIYNLRNFSLLLKLYLWWTIIMIWLFWFKTYLGLAKQWLCTTSALRYKVKESDGYLQHPEVKTVLSKSLEMP